ncbi:hypothetical protein [Salibaculum sp.]|uniref:hypothetical protein n=1 Tax=Salibaculum sp. TaxID=2855480 RepID=UPI002B47314C|nr:hypothetical protein [Salibaculum sp.]HKL69212.1 hypothetical protein [Salibaculum sp.]
MVSDTPIASFGRRGRRPLNLVLALAIWGGLALAVRAIDLSLIWAGLFGLFALPALVDWIADRQVRLTIYPDRMTWETGRSNGAMDAADIGHLRIDRRMDMGIRLTIVDINGRLHRLPPELHAPAEALATALDQAGIAHERHPFSLIPG